ncbi:response regulator transcription factor [Jeotgalibacillus marinus]|uniref:Heme response regulator HssR n=1 Tax=Jeotgalibacillus marinus TaxID=86667 RepID=A0ABV3Q7K1_9BACL
MDLKILIVDDDENIRELVRLFLEKEGFQTTQVSDGNEASELLEKETFHCAVIDIMMPNMDGWALCEEIKQYYEMPVLMLTARSEVDDRIKGFKLGTDDYLTKPFHPMELVMRVKSILKRYNLSSDEIITLGAIQIDTRKYSVSTDDMSISLPVKQFDLLYTLARSPGKIFTRDQLIEKIWGFDYEGDDRTVDTQIKRLRKNLSDMDNQMEIKTVRGLGYKLERAK